MANEDDEQLPNTLKESLASIDAEVEHAANLEHSKSGCLTLQKAAVEGVPAKGKTNRGRPSTNSVRAGNRRTLKRVIVLHS